MRNQIGIRACGSLLAVALSGEAAVAQTNIDASMTVDNQFTAYLSTNDAVQGTQIGTGNDWNVTFLFSGGLTPGVTNYLHIVATDTGPPAAFIGQFSLDDNDFEFANGTQTLLTNTTHWQVSATGFGANYQTPSDLGPDGTAPWNNRPGIDNTARFIWHPAGPGNTVYFSTAIVPAGTTTRATFSVAKLFADGNPNEVEVTISCNTGLPLEQSSDIGESNDVEFVVVDFDDGELDCTVSEASPDGYTAEYNADDTGDEGEADDDGNGCHFSGVHNGDEFFCAIANYPDPVDVEITKDWVLDLHGNLPLNGVSTEYEIKLQCDGQIASANNGGYIHNYGTEAEGSGYVVWDWDSDEDETFEASVYPDEFGANECTVTETVYDSAVEVDNGCSGVFDIDVAGGPYTCRITNTVFFEGIPTLNQYGLVLLALLTLGVGFIGFRRVA